MIRKVKGGIRVFAELGGDRPRGTATQWEGWAGAKMARVWLRRAAGLRTGYWVLGCDFLRVSEFIEWEWLLMG